MLQHPRIVAVDRLRGAIMVLVVMHHAMLAYASFAVIDPAHYLRSTAPIVDAARWAAVDLPIVFNDGFFMPLMFLLSGLFAWPALHKRGAAAYAGRRSLRLGVPFALAAVLVMPLAHYPALLARGDAPGFGAFWWHSATQGPWPSGPLWFVWVLLAFDLALAGGYAVLRRIVPRGLGGARAVLQRPIASFFLLLGIALTAYLPLMAAFGADHWLACGPFAVQLSRIGLYAAYFAAGVALGAGNADGAWLRALARHWMAWTLAALLAFALFVHAIGLYGAAGGGTSLAQRIGYGAALCLFAATAAHAAPALTARFAQGAHRIWDSLARNGYGIYLLHYLPVVWIQYALLASPLPTPCKVALAFAGGLAGAWACTAVLRRTRTGARVL
jgi:surface polysaccharide O-acyltransferase-like enzyme